MGRIINNLRHLSQYMQRTKDKPKSELSPKVEKTLEDIATGKEKLVKYDNFDEYIKHVKQILEE